MGTAHKMLVLAAAAFLPLASFCHAKNGVDESAAVVHGTVNVALANKNGLVVLTDSMLTTGDGKQLKQHGQKLFKLDDQTVCAIAGFVSAGGPTPELSADTSALIQEYVRQSRGQPPQSISEKLRALAALFTFHLTAIAELSAAGGANTDTDAYRFHLLIAGYDVDGKPKIGRIKLRSGEDLLSVVEDAEVVNVGEGLIYRVHGIPDVAEEILKHPNSKSTDSVLKGYAIAMSKDGGRSLTLDQLAALAKRLAYYTSKCYREVGGRDQFALIQKSSTIQISQPRFPDPPKLLLEFGLFVDVGFSGVVMVRGNGHNVYIRCRWIGTRDQIDDVTAVFLHKSVSLDGHYFIGNTFQNVAVSYDGGPFFFDDRNQVLSSSLVLGPHAKRQDRAVVHLQKSFPWLEPRLTPVTN